MPESSDADWYWAIVLDSGGVIRNKDQSCEIPPVEDLEGTTFIRPVFSELDTRLQFGVGDEVRSEVVLVPTQYTVSDPVYSEGEIYPQVPVEMVIPPDPSDERVADGPTEEEGDMREVPETTENDETTESDEGTGTTGTEDDDEATEESGEESKEA